MIFLNTSEQTGCLTSLKRFDEEVFSCGIEKLTSGAGGCCDYSIADVTSRLEDKLRNLDENYQFNSSRKEWDQTCSSCLSSREDRGEMHSVSTAAESLKVENEICRFAVLVTLTGIRLEDDSSFQQFDKCQLARDHGYLDPNGKAYRGVINDSYGYMHLKKKDITSQFHHLKCMHPDTCYQRSLVVQDFRLKEVYAATNNLNELNFISEGTAGKVYKGVLSSNENVAVKYIINDGNVKKFVREVTSLSNLKHPNLVALLGYCLRGEECFLINELCPNGNLFEWLFGIPLS